MYSFEGRIRYSECDETGRLSLFSLMNYLQDCSTFQSAELGQGIGSLTDRNLAWVLANWAIEVSRLPRFGEKIRVSTWCYEMSRAHALRNFRIEDAAQNVQQRSFPAPVAAYERHAVARLNAQICGVEQYAVPVLQRNPVERKQSHKRKKLRAAARGINANLARRRESPARKRALEKRRDGGKNFVVARRRRVHTFRNNFMPHLKNKNDSQK